MSAVYLRTVRTEVAATGSRPRPGAPAWRRAGAVPPRMRWPRSADAVVAPAGRRRRPRAYWRIDRVTEVAMRFVAVTARRRTQPLWRSRNTG